MTLKRSFVAHSREGGPDLYIGVTGHSFACQRQQCQSTVEHVGDSDAVCLGDSGENGDDIDEDW